MKKLAPLPDDLLELLDAERELDAPPSATRERMFARLAPLLLPPAGGIGGDPGAGGGGGPPTAATGGGPGAGAAAGAGASVVAAGWKAKVVLSAISLAVGAGGGAATHAWVTTPKPQPVVAAPVATSSAASEAPPPVPTEPTEAAAADSAPLPSASPRPEDRRASATLRAERLLIETANAALVRGDHASAIATLRRHAASFPKGELAQEREVLLVQALKASGDDTAAQQRAKDFKKKFPGSMQQGTVDKASPSE